MSFSIPPLGASKKYTNQVALGLTNISIDNTTGTVTFSLNDGSSASWTFPLPSDGVSVSFLTVDLLGHLIVTMTDGTTHDAGLVPPQIIEISNASGNALTKRDDGLYVSMTGLNIDPATDNQLSNTVNGLYVPHDSTKVDTVTGKELITSTLIPKITDNESHIGDITTLVVPTVTDLVSAINVLFNSFMTSITYASKKLTITYRNGGTVDIDMSAIITDTNITELNNVDDTGITDKQVLAYDLASQKYKPFTIDTSSVLQDAKDYTDQEIGKINTSAALAVDEKPVYDASGTDPVINYKQSGIDKSTTNLKTWFYYHDADDNKDYQTIFIEGVEFTLAVANTVDFDDYVKVLNVVSTYTGTEADKTKVPDIAALDALKGIIDLALADKVNTADIVDNLLSTDATKPLSANQGNQLALSKLDNTTDTSNAGKAVVVDDEGKLVFGEAGVQVSQTTGNAIETKLDGIFVEESITDITQADYDLLSSVEKAGKFYNITDATPQALSEFLIDDDNASTSKAYSSSKVNDLIDEVNQNLGSKNLNSYTSINQIGFSSWNDVTDLPTLVTAMSNNSILHLHINSSTRDIIDGRGITPDKLMGILQISKSARISCTFTEATASTIYVNSLNNETSTPNGWKKLLSADMISNPNLLDNPWFTVNQRGQSSYSGSEIYTVDRWKLQNQSGEGNITVNSDNSLTIVTKNNDGIKQIVQALIYGKTYTISCLTNLRLYTKTFVYDNTLTVPCKYNDDSEIQFAIISSETSNTVYPYIQYSGNQITETIKAVKLELGSVSTLAMDTAPNYQQELAKCQRYYQRIYKNAQYAPFGIAFGRNSTTLTQILNLIVPMREQPTLTYKGTVSALGDKTVSSLIPVLNGSVGSGNETDKTMIRIDYTGNFTVGSSYLLASDASGFSIELSADL